MKKLIAGLLLAGMLLGLCACGDAAAPGETTEPSGFLEESFQPEASVSAPTDPETDPSVQPQTLSPTGPDTTVPVVPEPEDDDFVPVLDYIPDLVVELKYASGDNFTGQVIYEFREAYLRYGTVKKLMAVQERLGAMGCGLKLWDGFRPVSAQFTLWEVCPDPIYVANPNTGHSSHSRGNTVDVTLVDYMGEELAMPTGFDDFSALADRDYSDCPEDAAQNALLLQTIMEEAGFNAYYGEWWHFSDEVQYPVEEQFQPMEPRWYFAHCNEFITLRKAPDVTAEEITRIPVNDTFLMLAKYDDFYYVNYKGVRGYVLSSYAEPME